MSVLSIGLIAALLAALGFSMIRLRARVQRLEREAANLSRSVSTVQGWATKELTSVRAEFTVNRVNEAAAQIKARRAQKREALEEPPPEPDDPEGQRDTIAMPAPAAPTPRPEDDDDAATHVFDPDPPRYARRGTVRPPAPLADPDLIGCEDIADETALAARLGPDDKTPPHGRRAAVLVPVFRAPEKGSAA